MARDGKLPAVLARVHPRYGTPYVSTLVVAGISLAVGLLFANRLDELSRIVNFGALTGFLLLHMAVIRHYVIQGGSRAWLRHLVMPLAGFVVIGYVLYEMDGAAKIMGAAWIGVGIVYFAALSLLTRKPPALDL
jgi:amino acid transporter